MMDTTFGVVIDYFLLQVSMRIWIYDTGHYMTPEGTLDAGKWVVQATLLDS